MVRSSDTKLWLLSTYKSRHQLVLYNDLFIIILTKELGTAEDAVRVPDGHDHKVVNLL